ncbi:MAG: phosphatidylglycerophosphatase A [Candidatus Omnitrophica bacterium]|nr:phosphatidylglycerophosphatase A [Candidatus Omnitrophota bacterium]
MNAKIAKIIATFFYIGEIPAAPGTIASLAGVFIYLTLFDNPAIFIFLTVFVTGIGFVFSGKHERALKTKDPGCIVIDEVAGMMISLMFLPVNFAVLITAFFLFRAFDMFKIYPVNKMEDLGGSLGIMADDIFAGIYANLIMHIALLFVPGKG